MPAAEREAQTFASSSSIASRVSLTPSGDGDDLREERPYFLATVCPKEPPPWTTTTGSPEEAIALPRRPDGLVPVGEGDLLVGDHGAAELHHRDGLAGSARHSVHALAPAAGIFVKKVS